MLVRILGKTIAVQVGDRLEVDPLAQRLQHLVKPNIGHVVYLFLIDFSQVSGDGCCGFVDG